MKFFKKIIGLSLILIVSGCGFHLQGKYVFADSIKNLAITLDDCEPFQKLLKDSLIQNGVNIKNNNIQNNKINNIATLEINNPVIQSSIHSYDSRGQVSQYKLVATISYKLVSADRKLLKENIITRSRMYAVDANKLLSNSNEQQIISEELNVEIINELLKQLSACS